MTATIKPATPLPWSVGGTTADQSVAVKGASGRFVAFVLESGSGTARAIAATNAAYIVHAANAYPELVAALREIRQEVIMIVEDGTIPPSALSHPSMKKAEALLRELGELK